MALLRSRDAAIAQMKFKYVFKDRITTNVPASHFIKSVRIIAVTAIFSTVKRAWESRFHTNFH